MERKDSNKTATPKWRISKSSPLLALGAAASIVVGITAPPPYAVAYSSRDAGAGLREQAKECNKRGQYKQAESDARQALEADRATGKTRSQAIETDIIPELEDYSELGRALLNQRRTDEAVQLYQEAVERSHVIGSKADTAVLRSDIGESLRSMGKTAEAETMLLAALKDIEGNVEKDQRYAKIYHNLAVLYLQLGRYPEALKCAQQAVSIAQQHSAQTPHNPNDFGKLDGKTGEPTDEYEGRAECFLAEVQMAVGDTQGAAATYQRIKSKFDTDSIKVSAPDVIINAEVTEGNRLNQQHEMLKALEHYKNAVATVAPSDLDPANANTEGYGELLEAYLKALTNQGSVAADLGKFADAQVAHQNAFERAAALHEVDAEADAASQLAEDYLMQGRTEQALRFLKKTVADFGDSPAIDKYRADLDIGLAKCYKQLGQKEAAVRLVQDAIARYRASNNPVMEALATNTIATIYLDFNDLDKFDQLQQSMEKLKDLIKDPSELARLEYNRGQALTMRNKNAEAVTQFKKAKELADKTVDASLKASVDNGLGLALYRAGDYQGALDQFKEALSLASGSNSLDISWSCNLGVGKALKALQRYDEAESYLKKSVDLVEQERATFTRDAFKTFNQDFRRDCFLELVEVESRRDKPYEALEIAERGKARAFQDMLGDKRPRRIDVIDEGSAKAQSTNSPVAAVAAAAAAAAGSRSVSVMARDDEPEETVESTQTVSPPSLDELKAAVSKRGSTCVEYLRIGDKFYVWVLQPDGSIKAPAPLAGGPDVRQLIRDLNDNMIKSSNSPDELNKINFDRQKKLARLYDILVKPIEQFLPADKNADVTIIPDGWLFGVPFAALVDAKGNFFIERHTLSYAPAIGVLVGTQKFNRGNAGDPHNLLAFGNPITKAIAFLGALPYTEKEVNKIAGLYGQSSSMVKIGESATKAEFEQLAPNYTEIHLATHGLVNEEHPMRSALVLAPNGNDDGLLMAKEIMRANNLKKARLVVLSACETGKGQITGDGVVGLSRAFITAGAPSVLVSQWNVDDVMTAFQMGKFYAAYLKGNDKSAALRDAQLATIQFMENTSGSDAKPDLTKPRANPRYWAAFQLIGENR